MIKYLKINKKLEDYISKNTYELHSVQKQIILHNQKLGRLQKMQISISQAYFLQFLIKTNKIKKILEIGTFTGFSSLSMGLVLPKNGKITCLDKNFITSKTAQNFFEKANLSKKIKIIIGPAILNLHSLIDKKKKYDLIFIDADKENYKKYFNFALKLIKVKGFIIIDNVLWHGDVTSKNKNDRLTNIIREFNSFIKDDSRVEKTILPIGDGLTICRKL